MMKILNRIVVLLAAAAIVAGCGDDANFNTPDNTITPGVVNPNSNGYIALSTLNVGVDREDEGFEDMGSGDYEEITATRATTAAADSYIVTITNESTGEEVYKSTYLEVQEVEENLTLKAGAYTVAARSCEEYQATSSTPEYAGSVRVVVGDENITTIPTITCTLALVKCQVGMSADLKSLFKTEGLTESDAPLTYTLRYGAERMTFTTETEGTAGYFAPQEGVVTIDVTLTGMYNAASDGEEPNYVLMSWSDSIKGVKAGQSRYITVQIDHYKEGKIECIFKIQTWTEDAPLGVDILSGIFCNVVEDSIIDPDLSVSDPDSAVLALDNELDIDKRYTISSSILDSEAQSYSPIYRAIVTPAEGASVSSVIVIFSSTNDSLMDDLVAAGYKDGEINIYSDESGAATTALNDCVAVTKDSETGAVRMTILYAGMQAMTQYIGEHSAKVIAMDSEGRTSYTTLRFETISDGGPEVIWDGGYDFNTRYEIYGGTTLPVVINMTTKRGNFTALRVKIISDVLTPDELGSMDLEQDMDLINPTTPAMATTLSGLGFPVGTEILNLSELTIDISKFMPMLADISMNGDTTDFQITVSDETGVAIKTIKLVNVIK